MGEMGTPHIAETIFTKIEHAKIFIADVSIINSDYKKRKTPNPNVLIELGYAARVLGWNKIICIYNTDYGTYDDLPFDLKYRRPLCYSGKNKGVEKKNIVDVIKENIHYMIPNEFQSIDEVGFYLLFETLNLYNNLEYNVKSILREFQEKYNFLENDILINISNDSGDRIKNKQSYGETDIRHIVNITFLDDNHFHNRN
jgi:hypothetical protein